MLSEDEEVSLRSAVKLVRLVVQETGLPGNKKLEADEALRRLLVAVCGSAELPAMSEHHRRPAA